MAFEPTPESVSKKVLGRVHRIDIWRAVIDETTDPPHRFRQIDLMLDLKQEYGFQTSVTQAELKALRDLNMIELDPTVSTHYRRTDSPIWRIAEVAIEVCGELGEETVEK